MIVLTRGVFYAYIEGCLKSPQTGLDREYALHNVIAKGLLGTVYFAQGACIPDSNSKMPAQ